MHKQKDKLTPDEVTELFSELDDSGLLDPMRVRDRSSRLRARGDYVRHGNQFSSDNQDERAEQESLANEQSEARERAARSLDPLSGADPSGSTADRKITVMACVFMLLVLAIVLGMQIWYGVSRRLNTANLSETVNTRTVSSALDGGLEWGNGFTQFPERFRVEEADERTGIVEVTVVDTDSANELELFSNSQIQAAALATNALLNDSVNQVIYNVDVLVNDNGDIQHDRLFGFFPAQGTERQIFTFVWTKHKSESSSNIDWELRIVGIDNDIAERIQEQVNSISSLIETPGVSQDDVEATEREKELMLSLRGQEVLRGGEAERSVEDVL